MSCFVLVGYATVKLQDVAVAWKTVLLKSNHTDISHHHKMFGNFEALRRKGHFEIFKFCYSTDYSEEFI